MDSHSTSSTGNWFEKYGTMLALFAGLALIAGALYFGHGLQPAAQQGTNNGQQAAAVDIKKVSTKDMPIVGSATAPVEMAVYFDYQCPYCKMLDQDVLSKVYTNYVQTGKVKLVLKDFDFIGPDSLVASEYAHAVWDLYPDKFYTWYSAMFAAQDDENKGFGDEASIQKLTATISGIDASKVSAKAKANKAQYDALVQANLQEGQGFGINGTPSIIIGTNLLPGGQTYETVSAAIEAQLKK